MIVDPAKAKHVPHDNYSDLWRDRKFINEDTVAEVKSDGSRYLLYLHPNNKSKLLSKRISDVTGEYVDKTENCPHLTRVAFPDEWAGTVLDGEMVHPGTEKSDATNSIMGCKAEKAIARQKEIGWLEYRIYDIPIFKGRDIRSLDLRRRREFLTMASNHLVVSLPIILMPQHPSQSAKMLYEEIVKNGGEGIMLKNLNAEYGKGWWKVKKVITDDVVIIGYEEATVMSKRVDGSIKQTGWSKKGWIGAIKFGQYQNGKLVDVGTCSGFPEDIRQKLSENRDKYIGQVIEITAQERTKTGKFRHPQFCRFREDKSAEQCVYENF